MVADPDSGYPGGSEPHPNTGLLKINFPLQWVPDPFLPRYIEKRSLMGQLSPGEIETLAKKWLDGSITPSEALVFDQWYEQAVDPTLLLDTGDKDAEAFRARLLERIKTTVAAGGERVDGEEPGFEQEAAGEGGKLIPMKRNIWPARLAAIACIILLAAGIWQWARVQENSASGVAGPLSQNILTTERGK